MIVIIDYGMGNLHSVHKAFELNGADIILSNKPEDIESAKKIVLPGVGAFGEGIKNLKQLKIYDLIDNEVTKKKKPLLGICLGMQLMAKDSEEFGFHKGFGWIDGHVKKFPAGLPIPHVGWNNIKIKENKTIFTGIPADPDFYFVHSYYLDCKDKDAVAATAEYGLEFTCSIQKNNLFGMQFHPEKSQYNGLQLIQNFMDV